MAVKQGMDLIFGLSFLYGPRRDKTCLRGFANNKGAGQPGHLHRLITRAFVIRLLESIISELLRTKFQFSSYSLCS